MKKKLKFNSRAIHGGQILDPAYGSVMTPIYQTSTYAQTSPGVHKGYEYSRTHNPTRTNFERSIASLENGNYGLAFASGLAAIDAIVKTLDPGDEIISTNDLYGGSYRLFKQIFEKYDLKFHFVNMENLDEVSNSLESFLKEFRKNKNHIAIVVDEYGGVSGMVTIEDVLEQIVGDIDDEFDYDETEDNIIDEGEGFYRIKASTEIEDFNEFFGTQYAIDEFTTVAGLISQKFGYLPERDEKINFDGFEISILRADSRQIHTVLAKVNLKDLHEENK